MTSPYQVLTIMAFDNSKKINNYDARDYYFEWNLFMYIWSNKKYVKITTYIQ